MKRTCLLLLAACAVQALAETPPSTGRLTLNESQVRALGITLIDVDAGGVAGSVRLPARVEVPLAQMRVLAAPIGAVVDTLTAVPGMSVRKGQLLARLSSPQALEIQRDALQAGAQAELARQSLQRDELLFAEGLIPEARLQATRAAARQAAAQSGERSRGLAMIGAAAGRLAGELELRAPIDGTVLSQDAQLGQRLEAGAAIYRIGRLSPLWLEIQVPQAMAAGLRNGDAVRVLRPAVNGRIVAVGRAIDAGSQSLSVRAEVGDGAAQLAPGQSVEVELVRPLSGGKAIPAAALVRQAGQTLVFVAAAGGGYIARPVRVLAESAGTVTVDGLAGGEKLVVTGVSGLKAMLGGHGAP